LADDSELDAQVPAAISRRRSDRLAARRLPFDDDVHVYGDAVHCGHRLPERQGQRWSFCKTGTMDGNTGKPSGNWRLGPSTGGVSEGIF